MEKNEKDTLDTYRQERKERIAKQSKKAAKKSAVGAGRSNKADKVIEAIIAVVVVVAILAASLNFFGVPHKAVKAVTIDGKSYSAAELGCYYMTQYNSVRSMAYTYDTQYGEGLGKSLTGYDTSLSPTEQTTKDHDDNEITWDEYFLEEAIESMAQVKRYYKAAVDAGIKLSDEDKEDINSTVESIKTSFQSSGAYNAKNYSVSSILTLNYGKGVTESLFRKVLTEQKYVELYQTQRQDELKAAKTDDDVAAVYNEDKTAYDVVSFRWYTLKVTSETASSEPASGEGTSKEAAAPLAEELKAQEFVAAVTSQTNYNEDTFKNTVLEFEEGSENYEDYKDDRATMLQKISKSVIKQNISEDAANWLFETDDAGNYVRQIGDIKYFLSSDSKTVYILFATGAPFCDDTRPVSVRHILVQYPTEATSEPVSGEEKEETTVSAEVKAECSSKADDILKEYKDYIAENASDAADEDYFGELASKYTDDPGSKDTGGLIEDMHNNGSYVENFEDWAFAEGAFDGETRTAGDTGIIETEYGYHVMYYVGAEDHPEWYSSILNELIEDEWKDEQTKFDEQFSEDAIVRKEKAENWVKKNCLKLIDG